MTKLDSLKHTKVSIIGGGHVIVLNTGAVIGPESEAMLQALHSRSSGGLEAHLEALSKRGSDNFMKNFYVGYGHKSIGDCGTTTIFIEGVSMLAAKAIQDWASYSGQEVSTRYGDWSKIPFFGPYVGQKGKRALARLRTFYLSSLPEVVKHLMERYPINEGESETEYTKAINARAFDAMRGFLPAGATTNLAWHTNFRQAADKIALLRQHSLLEVRRIAKALDGALATAYENSFGHKTYLETERYNAVSMGDNYFHTPQMAEFELVRNTIDTSLLPFSILKSRPAKTELPKWVAEAGTMQFEFLLDFASFRDIQRHRAVIQRMPLLTADIGFHQWYLSELPDNVQKEALRLLPKNRRDVESLDLSPEESQYYFPMGYKVSNRLTGDLPSLVYLVELRATRFVHPTLREVAIQMADVLKDKLGKHGLVIHLDDEPDRFDIARGKHDIVLK